MLTSDKNSLRGFTLIELIIVVIIVGILAALAMPSYNNAKTNAQDKDARNMLRMIRDEERMHRLRADEYKSCTNINDCNSFLGLRLPDDFWVFSVPNAAADSFCAQAVKDTRSWSIRQNEETAVTGGCP